MGRPPTTEALLSTELDELWQPAPAPDLEAGNVRDASALDLYREVPLFRTLRAETRLSGRCGRCSWRSLCGGSRARAYAPTGDPLGEEPTCPHQHEEAAPCST